MLYLCHTAVAVAVVMEGLVHRVGLGAERAVWAVAVADRAALGIGGALEICADSAANEVVERSRLCHHVATGHAAGHAHVGEMVQGVVGVVSGGLIARVGLRNVGFEHGGQVAERVHGELLPITGGVGCRDRVGGVGVCSGAGTVSSARLFP